jgi:hypothetical protein
MQLIAGLRPPVVAIRSPTIAPNERRRVGSTSDTSGFGCGQNTSYIYSCPLNQTLHGSFPFTWLVPLVWRLP